MYTYRARVIRVVDADTFDMDVDVGFGICVRHRFRVRGYDAPETWRPRNDAEREHGEQATTFAAKLLLNVDVVTRTHKLGIYGRYEADIELPDGRDYVAVMREAGFEKKKEY